MEPESSSKSSHPEQPPSPAQPPPSSSRCPQCNPQCKENTRNLVVCIDGTRDKFGEKNTNVVKLFASIDQQVQSPEQIAYYSSGIGTHPNSFHVLERIVRRISDTLDTAVAWSVEEIVKDAYRWLAERYKDGDQIYLFGFSRGAYQVRVLAGMIHEVGLIRASTEKQIGTAYDYFKAIRSEERKTREIARHFKNTFSWKDLRVHFVGVWDTVSSVGFIRGDLFLSTSSSAAHACHFRHALALDERRVKFMPEYFHEMNSLASGGKYRYFLPSNTKHTTSLAGKSKVTTNDNQIDSWNRNTNPDIKEVWFAGCHSDVGGKSKPGKLHLSGNVSLLWMRREATASGLKLLPTDLVWIPADLDLGIRNSMKKAWPFFEYFPIKHQMSFSGPGEDAHRPHLFRPRRIIPGQKVHESIRYANAYTPQATLGKGFDIPIVQTENTESKDLIWETGLFDETAAEELVKHLGSKEGVASIYLDRLLFMLRFEEGKECLRRVPNWQHQFMQLIRNDECEPFVKLVASIAYCEASSTSDPMELSYVLSKAKESMSIILTMPNSRGHLKIVTLLKPLTRHHDLRGNIFTSETLESLVSLKSIVFPSDGNSGQAVDSLICLLQYRETWDPIIDSLHESGSNSRVSRLSQMLETKNPHLLTAALRMGLTLARIAAQEVPKAKDACSAVMSRLNQLSKRNEGLVGALAVEILLTLDPKEGRGLDVSSKKVRTNLANALVHLHPERRSSSNDKEHSADPVPQILHQFFGLDTDKLTNQHKRLISELTWVVQKGNARERTALTMTLLKLCESVTIRTYLRRIHLLNMFIDQLQCKDRALLAAYALAACLKYADMKQSVIESEELPRNIVDMLRLDCFDDAVGAVEGFQIFGDLMQHDRLREKIRNHDITGVLNTKLGRGNPKEIRTSLICLDIFWSFGEEEPWTGDLVKNSLENLRDPVWKVQKAGVVILSAMAQTDHGVTVIGNQVANIVKMLLPQDHPSKPPSWMMGPACALRILAQNSELRRITRESIEYRNLKDLYFFGTLVDENDTRPWQVKTPNRMDVVEMLDKMFKVVEGELSETDLIPIGDEVLPRIQHWDRLFVAGATLPILLGATASSVLSHAGRVLVNHARAFRSFMNLGREEDVAIIAHSPHEGAQCDLKHEAEAPSGGHAAADEKPPRRQAKLGGKESQDCRNWDTDSSKDAQGEREGEVLPGGHAAAVIHRSDPRLARPDGKESQDYQNRDTNSSEDAQGQHEGKVPPGGHVAAVIHRSDPRLARLDGKESQDYRNRDTNSSGGAQGEHEGEVPPRAEQSEPDGKGVYHGEEERENSQKEDEGVQGEHEGEIPGGRVAAVVQTGPDSGEGVPHDGKESENSHKENTNCGVGVQGEHDEGGYTAAIVEIGPNSGQGVSHGGKENGDSQKEHINCAEGAQGDHEGETPGGRVAAVVQTGLYSGEGVPHDGKSENSQKENTNCGVGAQGEHDEGGHAAAIVEIGPDSGQGVSHGGKENEDTQKGDTNYVEGTQGNHEGEALRGHSAAVALKNGPNSGECASQGRKGNEDSQKGDTNCVEGAQGDHEGEVLRGHSSAVVLKNEPNSGESASQGRKENGDSQKEDTNCVEGAQGEHGGEALGGHAVAVAQIRPDSGEGTFHDGKVSGDSRG